MCRSRLAVVVATAVAVAALVRVAAQPASTHTVDDARKAFDTPPDDARVMMRWWWFGPATTEAQIARDLEAMKRAGLGGAEIQPVYPLALDEPAGGVVNMRFLSDEYLGALRVANERAARSACGSTSRSAAGGRMAAPPSASRTRPAACGSTRSSSGQGRRAWRGRR